MVCAFQRPRKWNGESAYSVLDDVISRLPHRMFFNSIDFAVFLPIVFALYWSLMSRELWVRNLFLVIVSYIFYGWWDPRFLMLILFSTTADYLIGNGLRGNEDPFGRKCLLWVSVLLNLSLLGVFKYYNFFVENFAEAFSFLGYQVRGSSLDIILPVGIVAGPIERGTHLLPQFRKLHRFDYARAVDGLRQILWGLVKKVVIADNCAHYANKVFNNTDDYYGAGVALGILAFTFQIYGDFSGYSDIAIGTSRLFGFDLKKNFAFPYFSRDIAEFWRRWHISLSTWFRDYLYIPLGGSRGSKAQQIRNVFIIFSWPGGYCTRCTSCRCCCWAVTATTWRW